MPSPDIQLHKKTQTDLFQNYDEIPERRAESLIGGKRYQTSVLKNKEIDLGGFGIDPLLNNASSIFNYLLINNLNS
ncbi:MAG: hypothetical protein P4L16_01355 [Chlamydiales bacterium]|nr:hypothetical protein [Chlamydiales bacterium]